MSDEERSVNEEAPEEEEEKKDEEGKKCDRLVSRCLISSSSGLHGYTGIHQVFLGFTVIMYVFVKTVEPC